MSPSKPHFSPESFQAVIDHINKHPELLENDWREIVRSHFHLTKEQENTLINVSHERHAHIHGELKKAGDHIRQGGTVIGHLVKRPTHEGTEMGYDIDIELKPKASK